MDQSEADRIRSLKVNYDGRGDVLSLGRDASHAFSKASTLSQSLTDQYCQQPGRKVWLVLSTAQAQKRETLHRCTLGITAGNC